MLKHMGLKQHDWGLVREGAPTVHPDSALAKPACHYGTQMNSIQVCSQACSTSRVPIPNHSARMTFTSSPACSLITQHTWLSPPAQHQAHSIRIYDSHLQRSMQPNLKRVAVQDIPSSSESCERSRHSQLQ